MAVFYAQRMFVLRRAYDDRCARCTDPENYQRTKDAFALSALSSGGFRGGPSRLRPAPLLGDGPTPSITVVLANAKF